MRNYKMLERHQWLNTSVLARDESGATMVEYAIMLAFIAAVCIVLVFAIGGKTSGEYSNLNALY